MIKHVFSLLFACLLMVSANAQQKIDIKNSVVNFTINGIMGIDVDGTFAKMKGDVTFFLDDLSNAQFNVCVEGNSLNTGISKRDEELRSEEFFDIEKHPRICFQSTETKKSAEGYLATGNLTIKGITKKVQIPFIFDTNTFRGELTVNRLDFNLGEDYGGFSVGKEAYIEIICDLEN